MSKEIFVDVCCQKSVHVQGDALWFLVCLKLIRFGFMNIITGIDLFHFTGSRSWIVQICGAKDSQ